MSTHHQELAAVQMLTKLNLTPANILDLVKNYDIDLDVSDSKGNTRLMISSVMLFFLFFFFLITLCLRPMINMK
jgi:hypothetical protein